MITALAWLAIGTTLWAGQAAAAVVAWLDGWTAVAILAALAAVSAGAGLWGVWWGGRLDQRQEQAPPPDGDPLTVYEAAVLKAIERGELYEGIYEDQGDC